MFGVVLSSCFVRVFAIVSFLNRCILLYCDIKCIKCIKGNVCFYVCF